MFQLQVHLVGFVVLQNIDSGGSKGATGTPLRSKFFYLPPANEVCEVYVFTGVCLSTGEGGVCPITYWDTHTSPPWPDTPVPGRPTLGKHTPRSDTPPNRQPPRAVHAGIWSTSIKYASHWNAFLFSCSFQQFLPPVNEVWGKVMFLHLSVSHSGHSSHRSGWYASYWNAYLILQSNSFSHPDRESVSPRKSWICH